MRASLLAIVALALFDPAMLEAHDGRPSAPHDLVSWRAWIPGPVVLTLAIVMGWLYGRGWANRSQPADRKSRLRAIALYGSLLASVLAVGTPVHEAGEALLSIHMVQHLLLIVVAAPLLVLARPLPQLLRAVPIGRGPAAWAVRQRGLHEFTSCLASLPAALGLHVAAVLIWHAPPLYQASLSSPLLHALEHATFFATAVLFWAAVFGRRGVRSSPGPAIFALFVVAAAGNGLGALMVFAPEPWYGHYELTAASWGTDALTDQAVAGVIMWMFGGLFYVGAAVATIVGSLLELDRRQQKAAVAGAGAAPHNYVARPE